MDGPLNYVIILEYKIYYKNNIKLLVVGWGRTYVNYVDGDI